MALDRETIIAGQNQWRFTFFWTKELDRTRECVELDWTSREEMSKAPDGIKESNKLNRTSGGGRALGVQT